MAVSLESLQHKKTPKPPRLLVYGVPKIGKTTLGANAPNPIVLQIEEGADEIDVTRTPKINTFDEVLEWLLFLATEDHQFQSVVVDSVDWLETMIHDHVVLKHPTAEKGKKVSNIEDYGYGKGYSLALKYWEDYIKAINYLRDHKKMAIIQIAHHRVEKFTAPDSEPYDKHGIKMHKGASSLLQEHSDAILFCTYVVGMKADDVGFGQKKNRAIGSGERLVKTQDRPAYLAGNRYDGMPDELPLDWDAIAQYIPYYQQQNKGE
jgi:hypothetical protein